MEPTTTSSIQQFPDADRQVGCEDLDVERRLARLIALNEEIERDKSLYRNDRERIEAGLMVRPVSSASAFAYFGLLLGTLPTVSIAIRVLLEASVLTPQRLIIPSLLLCAALATGLVGFRTGKRIPAIVRSVGQFRNPNRIAMYSLIGYVWGGLSGAAGGVFVFLIGAIPGAFVGGIIGALAVPAFVVLHDVLRRGDMIERKHFLPVSLGITLTVAGAILGF